MAYSAEISRANPSCFVFVIDQSGSMNDSWGGQSGKKKKDGVADAINRLLQDLVIKCAKEEGVRDYYHVGVIGYGSSIGPAFSGALSGQSLVPISAIADTPARLEERRRKLDDGAGGLAEQTVKFPVWFEPIANGGTPMNQALGQAAVILEDFVKGHPDCFPPVVIHITDGESTDGDPAPAMGRLTALSSTDGNVLLFNLHISTNPGTIAYPSNADGLPDAFARTLFNGASVLTDFMKQVASEHDTSTSAGSKAFVLNATPIEVIQALDIGTRPSNLR
jgi:uncharacterized protein YegL